jgi:hypothetical protein
VGGAPAKYVLFPGLDQQKHDNRIRKTLLPEYRCMCCSSARGHAETQMVLPRVKFGVVREAIHHNSDHTRTVFNTHYLMQGRDSLAPLQCFVLRWSDPLQQTQEWLRHANAPNYEPTQDAPIVKAVQKKPAGAEDEAAAPEEQDEPAAAAQEVAPAEPAAEPPMSADVDWEARRRVRRLRDGEDLS